MNTGLKILTAAIGAAALAATPAMAKTNTHRGPDVVYPTFPKAGPTTPYVGHDIQLEGRLPVPETFIPYHDVR